MPTLATAAAWWGAMAGLGALVHGIGEIAQGNVATTGLFVHSWTTGPIAENLGGEPGITLIPNVLASGIVTSVAAVALVWTSVRLLSGRDGGRWMVGLSALLLLAGGGVGPPVIGLCAGVAALVVQRGSSAWTGPPPLRDSRRTGYRWLFSLSLLLVAFLVFGSLFVALVLDMNVSSAFVYAFFALAFAISWGFLAWALGPGAFPAPAEQLQSVGAGLAILAGPSLAALLLIAVTEGAPGLRKLGARLRRWRVRPVWYAVALLFAPLLSLAVSLASTGVSRDFLPAIATSDAPGALIGTAFASAVMIGFVEELGWTGYAVPRLLRRSGVQATGIMVGLLWGAWHFPLFWEASSFLGALGLGLLLARLFSWLPPFRVLMVWVYDRTESLLVVALMHVSLVLSTLLFQPAVSGLELLAFVLVWAVALWVAAGAVVFADRRWARRRTARRRAV